MAAATLSNRYITDRFLPDKAIDLVDEAASRLRMQIDSKPEAIDELDRRIVQLKIEREALKKETDEASQGRLERLEQELADLEERSGALTLQWRREKDAIDGAKGLKEELERARLELEATQRRGELERASELRFAVIPDLERRIAETNGQREGRLLDEEVAGEHVAGVVSRWTGVPVARMLEGEREKLLQMEERLHARIVGQDRAVEAVSEAVRRARAGLHDPSRPVGSFLFLGPTGVGKTELCKALAEFLFDDDTAMLRLDMSEYMEKHSVSRMLGAPPGYVGYEEGGSLTESVRRRPYQVVLFDEVEKAHPDIFNVLLQVLDDGRLTDGHGRTVDFRNTILVMTSNLGGEIVCGGERIHDARAARGPGDECRSRPFPARVPEPARRDRRLPPAGAQAHGRHRLDPARGSAQAAHRPRHRARPGPGSGGLVGGDRLRPRLWRAPAEARDPDPPPERPRQTASRRQGAGRRPRGSRRRGRRARHKRRPPGGGRSMTGAPNMVNCQLL